MSRRAVTIKIDRMPPHIRALALRLKELEREWKNVNCVMNEQLRIVYGVETNPATAASLQNGTEQQCGKKRKCGLQTALDERQHFIDVSRDPRRVVIGYAMQKTDDGAENNMPLAIPPAAQQARPADTLSIAQLQLLAQRLFEDLDDGEQGITAPHTTESAQSL